ncbi:MAG: deoxyribodipyrimidine photolyase [Myxococcales bacterium]|nr:deoxyribodipyrimidine photolyase [Polyangiaceae bacterium]MDW8251154.1 deoxyribodipyrimidine photolyase [Myxococcales bacterium]
MPQAFQPSSRGSSIPLAPRLDADPRLRILTPGAPGHRGSFVLYWPQMARRADGNAAFELAVAEANSRRLPLAVYEALRVDYPYASDRIHAFVLEGAAREALRYRRRGASYAFFLPRDREESRGVLLALARQAALLITDDFPTFVVPGHLAALARRAPCPVWAFDDNTVIPLSLLAPEQYAACTLRPRVDRLLDLWLRPLVEGFCEAGPASVDWPFPPLPVEILDRSAIRALLPSLPLDHSVPPVELQGGSEEARRRLAEFLQRGLASYPERNHPDDAVTTGLSPYLHFGMIGVREVALAVREAQAPAPARDALLEQLLVRRTLAFNLARENPWHTTFDALPGWARDTLREHQGDPRPKLYSRQQLEEAATDDPVWNAAQRELRATGVIHNYLRMLWGKGVIAWKARPEEAFEDLVFLNDRWALDGRDPNSYANILWCFGKHDRPWGPRRPIFGTVRYMSTAVARKKLRMERYLARWS